jgi:hypothetical protein
VSIICRVRASVIVVALSGCALASGCGSGPDGYTPEQRAAQLEARLWGKHGPLPRGGIRCVYKSDAGEGRAWYACEPGGGYVACDKRTTDEPLTGPMRSSGIDWGDCMVD